MGHLERILSQHSIQVLRELLCFVRFWYKIKLAAASMCNQTLADCFCMVELQGTYNNDKDSRQVLLKSIY